MIRQDEGTGPSSPPPSPVPPALEEAVSLPSPATTSEAQGPEASSVTPGKEERVSPARPLSPPLLGPPVPTADTVEDEVRELLGQFTPPPSQPPSFDLEVNTAVLVHLDSVEAERERAAAIAREMADVMLSAQEVASANQEADDSSAQEAARIAPKDVSVRPTRSLLWIRGEARTLPRPKGVAKRVTFDEVAEEADQDGPGLKPVQSVTPTVRPRREPSAITLPTVLHPRILMIAAEDRGPQEWDSPSAGALIERPRGAAPTSELPRPMLRLDDGYRRHRYNPRWMPTVDDYEPGSLPPRRSPSPELGAPVRREPKEQETREANFAHETSRLQAECQRQEAFQRQEALQSQEASHGDLIREAIAEQHRRLEELHGKAAQKRRRSEAVQPVDPPMQRPEAPATPPSPHPTAEEGGAAMGPVLEVEVPDRGAWSPASTGARAAPIAGPSLPPVAGSHVRTHVRRSGADRAGPSPGSAAIRLLQLLASGS